MVPIDIVNQARYLTRTANSDGAGDDADMLRILNDYYRRMIMVLVNTNQDKFGRKGFTNLTVNANQEYYRLPPDCIRLKRLEITYDGSQWYKVRMQDSGTERDWALDSTTINNQFYQSDPYADIFGDSIYLRPIPTASVTNGLKLWYIRMPSELSTLSSALSKELPIEFQMYLSYGMASEIATKKGDETMASQMFQKWEDGQNKVREQFNPYNLDYRMDFQVPTVNYA